MLENTKIFESAENKELDGLLKKYNDLKVLIDDMSTTQKQCADRIKELCGKKGGKYETLNAVFTLKESAGKSSIDVGMLKNKYEDVWEEVPSECISIKVSELKKFKSVWEELPSECIRVGEPVLSMGEIIFKTKV
jgi:hypothetical protein